MNPTNQSLKVSKQKKSSYKKMSTKMEIRSEIYLNIAFDRLNRCKARIQTVYSEVSDILSDSIKCGVELYKQAVLLHNGGHFQNAISYAKTASQFCNLLSNLADESTENILKLPIPPSLRLIESRRIRSNSKLHPALRLLESLIQKKMSRASHFYKSRLNGYHEIISDVSKKTVKIEQLH